MRLLRGIGMGVLAAGVALAAAGVAKAQSGQQTTQQTSGNTGSSPTPTNNNVPYNPPAPPPGGYGDASTGSYSGHGTSGYGGGQSNGSGSGGGQSGNSSGLGHIGANSSMGDDTPQTPQQIELEQARARNAERQKELVADTQKLVSLANELQDEVSKSSKDMLSLDVVRKADEIDKLARTVRDRMKNAN